MIAAFRRALDGFLGRGEAGITVPVLDGPLKPNQALEAAAPLLAARGLDNLVRTPSGVLFSSGAELMRLDGGLLAKLEAPIACLAAAPDGALAVGLDGTGLLIRGGAHDGWRSARVRCPTAALFLDAATLIVANGADGLPAAEWRRDLMQHGRSGALWRFDLAGGAETCLADRLAWPWGVAPAPDGGLFVSEAWRHRVLHLATGRAAQPPAALADLPAYPARIVPASDGGYWLTFASVRNQLVEFILREDAYRRRMLAEVPEPFWMAPALSSGASFDEPLQGSGLKQMGMQKPWAATRSYGLVARCDATMQPRQSWHSRGDGHVHGVLSVIEDGRDLLVAAKGPGLLLRLTDIAGTAPALAETVLETSA